MLSLKHEQKSDYIKRLCIDIMGSILNHNVMFYAHFNQKILPDNFQYTNGKGEVIKYACLSVI